MKTTIPVITFILFLFIMCKKENNSLEPGVKYYEIAFKTEASDWRDTSFIVATSNADLIQQTEEQLGMPVSERQMVNGRLLSGNGGYNINASHSFRWHFDENDWHYTDMSVEVLDGRPFTDVDTDTAYWIHTLGRYAPWNSYVAREREHP